MATTYTLGSTLVQISDVSLAIDGRPILRNITAEIRDIVVPGRVTGQIVGILGPSGAGKTSLFRIIAGLTQPTSGRVTLSGSDHPVTSGEVGVVAQNYPLFAHRTVESNLLLAARRKYGTQAREQVMTYLTAFGLTEHLHAYPSQLSGGQRQRIAILQQVLCSGHILLLDEPFSGLDPIMKSRTQQLLLEVANLHEQNTLIVVSHDIAAVAAIADHLWLLGRTPETQGSTLVQTYDLIERDLAWHPDLTHDPRFAQFVAEVDQRFRTL